MKVIHLTIESIKRDPRYQKFIDNLRAEGWLDWQITLAILNHIASYKLNVEMASKSFISELEKQNTLNNISNGIINTDESENYVPLPLDYFLDPSFKFQLKQVAHCVLNSWGLENKSQFPNFSAIQEFLTVRFNFAIDDDLSKSPL